MSDSVRKAFRIIRFLAVNQGSYSLSEISRATNLNKTTTHRYLETLESLNLLDRHGQHYSLGMALFELGNKVPIKRLFVNRIHPLLKDLCDEVNETVSLAQLFDTEALYLDKIESRRSLQFQATIGSRLPLHCTALGKSILSILPAERAEQIITTIELPRITPKTITDREKLRRQVGEIRERGFAIDNEEFEEGLVCIAVPLLIEELDFHGGISLSGPAFRFTEPVVRRLAETLKKTAGCIRQRLSG